MISTWIDLYKTFNQHVRMHDSKLVFSNLLSCNLTCDISTASNITR